MSAIRNYQWNGHSIKIKFRPYGILLWLGAGFEVWIDEHKKFTPELDRLTLNTHTDFEIELQDGLRVTGLVKTLKPMWFFPRTECSVVIGDVTIAREVFTIHRWYLVYVGWLIVFLLFLLMGFGVLFIMLIVPLIIAR